MKKTILTRLIVTIVLTMVMLPISANNKLVTYPAPKGAMLNGDFTVSVRQADKDWQQVPSYLVKVQAAKGLIRNVEEASMASFDFQGKVEVRIVYNKEPITTARVRPLSYDIEHQIEGNTISFILDRPRNLSIEVNGDIFHNLHLFANPIDEYVINQNDPNLIYFGTGVHEIDEEEFKIPSNKTVYLAGGAVLKGRLLVENAQNVKILGRGMICHTVKHGIKISNSKNVLVEGIFATQCSTGGSDSVTIRNVKSISYYSWGDGMNVFASNNVLHDGVFCRNSDDCTTVYGTRLGYEGACKNITMQNSTLWADIAHPIFIGIHGNADKPEVLENLNYKNIDILDHRESQIDYQGCLAINVGDNNTVRDVTFEDIRIENFRKGQLLNLRIFYNKKYCAAPGIGIENVLFKNISYTGDNAEVSMIIGYNEDRKIKNIHFENLNINGQVISDDMPGKPGFYKTGDLARIFIGEHVEGVSFSK
ncbi:endopolygalacturonase [Bacteroides propionicifaciens]|uniref:endopolygalacturonase n=1 Tax=Bacteroides propionicifaciens TaxID=392838 RepID=UPI000468B03B|nr:endopolygalacturonase [Bacteroides propionicifaciens]